MYNVCMKAKGKKEKILKTTLSLLGLVLIGVVTLLVLYFTGLMEVDGFNVSFNGLFTKLCLIPLYLKIIVYLLLFVLISILTSVVPFVSMGLILLGVGLFRNLGGSWLESVFIVFAITLSGVMLSSLSLYLLGRFGGRKLGSTILGEEDIEKATELLETKGQVYLPLMLMFPMFPDDALCFASGVLKMKWWYFTLVALIFRGVGVLTICFGASVWDYTVVYLTNPIMWFLFITALAFWVVVILYLANKLDKFLEKKKNKTSD